MVWYCLTLIPIAMMVSLPSVAVLNVIGRRLGTVDQPGSEAHKQHTQATPNLGGIGIFAGLLLPIAAALLAAWLLPPSTWQGKFHVLANDMPGIREYTPMVLGLLAAMAVMHAMGLVDDRRSLSALPKLAVQLGVAALLVVGFDLRVLHLLDQFGATGYFASIAVTVLWFGVVINAINMLDNMDGLAGGVAAIIAGLYLAATLIGGQYFVAALAALLLGSLLGFLMLNFPPAKIFMGDGGSMVIGLTLAVLSVRTTYIAIDPTEAATAAESVVRPLGESAAIAGAPITGAWYGLLMPLLLMAVPLYDFTSVVVLRLLQGKSPFVGDRQHFSHRLLKRGMSTRTAVVIVYLCTLATGLGGVMLNSLDPWQAALVAVQAAGVIVILALLEFGMRTTESS